MHEDNTQNSQMLHANENSSKNITRTNNSNMATSTSQSSSTICLKPKGADPVVQLHMMHPKMSLLEKFEQNSDETQDKGCCLNFDNRLCAMLGRWWNAHYKWQHRIIHFVENTCFHTVIIILVLLDCLLIVGELILDFIKINKTCELKLHHGNHEEKEKQLHHIEITVEVLHYTSVGLLGFFLLEVLAKVFAFGRHWWNPHDKKMEWLDASIVIISFLIDVITIFSTSYYAEIALLFIILRLWRIVRIINSVAQSMRAEDESKKKHLASSYHRVIETIMLILEKKTILLSRFRTGMPPEKCNDIRKKFKSIDNYCREVFDNCPHPSSFREVNEMGLHLQDAIEKLQLAPLTRDESYSRITDV